MSNVVFRCVCLIVCVTLGPKAVISRGEQNRYGWRRRTLITARLSDKILRQLTADEVFGGLRRRLGALVNANMQMSVVGWLVDNYCLHSEIVSMVLFYSALFMSRLGNRQRVFTVSLSVSCAVLSIF